MKIDDRILIAYVNGELDAAGRAEVEAAIAVDPVLGVRLDEHRLLRGKVQAESVPARLLAAARAGAKASLDNVVKLDDRRRPPPPVRAPIKLTWPAWGSLAATLLVGVVGGYVLSQQNPGVVAPGGDGVLVARGGLSRALDRNLSASGGPVQLGLSFKTADARYCRAFQVAARRVAGVACHEGARWVARMITDAPAPTRSFDSRGSVSVASPSVRAAVAAMIDGAPLDRQGEIAARARRWRE